MVLGVAELLKLVLIERLFNLCRDKLMSIPAFAWGYGKFQLAQSWVVSLGAWRRMRRLALTAKRAVRKYVLEIKTSRKRQRLFPAIALIQQTITGDRIHRPPLQPFRDPQ